MRSVVAALPVLAVLFTFTPATSRAEPQDCALLMDQARMICLEENYVNAKREAEETQVLLEETYGKLNDANRTIAWILRKQMVQPQATQAAFKTCRHGDTATSLQCLHKMLGE